MRELPRTTLAQFQLLDAKIRIRDIKVFAPPVGQAIDGQNARGTTPQPLNEVRADEPTTTGDSYVRILKIGQDKMSADSGVIGR